MSSVAVPETKSAGSPAAAARRRIGATTIASALGLAALVVLPLLAGGYWTFTLGVCFANAIAIIAVSFLVRVKEGVEDPRRLLLDL